VTAQDAQLVIDYIEKHGWTQYTIEDEYGKVCLVGALDLALQPLNTIALTKCLKDLLQERWLSSWNDEIGRKKEDVINLLNKAKESC
jgi:hypothetical protein